MNIKVTAAEAEQIILALLVAAKQDEEIAESWSGVNPGLECSYRRLAQERKILAAKVEKMGD